MLRIVAKEYDTFELDKKTTEVLVEDHLRGFDIDLRSPVLDRLELLSSGRPLTVHTEYIVNQQIQKNYPTFKFVFALDVQSNIFDFLRDYNVHPELTFENFLCSFNGAEHVGRKLLVSILHKFKLFNPNYSSKLFVFSNDMLTGHICDYVGDRENFYNKFFVSDDEFSNTVYGSVKRGFNYNYNHLSNIFDLEKPISESFVHLVSSTMATSYYPLYCEKFLYSIVTRGLFVTHGQPGWHSTLERCYGFKLYKNLFDYKFDSVINPIDRLLDLVTMLGKFSQLSSDDWRDLYLLEQENIEYNYDHYRSRGYLNCLSQCKNIINYQHLEIIPHI